jgi:hypothetical protein
VVGDGHEINYAHDGASQGPKPKQRDSP